MTRNHLQGFVYDCQSMFDKLKLTGCDCDCTWGEVSDLHSYPKEHVRTEQRVKEWCPGVCNACEEPSVVEFQQAIRNTRRQLFISAGIYHIFGPGDGKTGYEPGGSNSQGCFEENEKVYVKEFGEKKMKELLPGDWVKTCDGSWTRNWMLGHRTLDGKSELPEIDFLNFHFTNGKTLKITPNHYMELSSNEFILARNVRVGDQVMSTNDENIYVEKIESTTGLPILPLMFNHKIMVNGVCSTIMVENFEAYLWMGETVFIKFLDKYIIPYGNWDLQDRAITTMLQYCADDASNTVCKMKGLWIVFVIWCALVIAVLVITIKYLTRKDARISQYIVKEELINGMVERLIYLAFGLAACGFLNSGYFGKQQDDNSNPILEL